MSGCYYNLRKGRSLIYCPQVRNVNNSIIKEELIWSDLVETSSAMIETSLADAVFCRAVFCHWIQYTVRVVWTKQRLAMYTIPTYVHNRLQIMKMDWKRRSSRDTHGSRGIGGGIKWKETCYRINGVGQINVDHTWHHTKERSAKIMDICWCKVDRKEDAEIKERTRSEMNNSHDT